MAGNPPVYKVALCGQSDVGKTSIFRRIKGDGFRENTKEFDHVAEWKINLEVHGRRIQILLCDTAGMERYSRLTRTHYHGSQVVLFVYDCDDVGSLEAITGYYKEAEYNATGAAMVLVRNMIDKEDQSVDDTEAENKLCSQRTGKDEPCRFAFKGETSAKTNQGITELFQDIGEYLLRNAEPVNQANQGNNVWPNNPNPNVAPNPDSVSTGCC